MPFLKQSVSELHLVSQVTFGMQIFGKVSYSLSSSQETREGLFTLLFPKQIFFHAVGQDGADPITQQRKQTSQGYGQLRLGVK